MASSDIIILKTVQCGAIKTLFDTLKDILTDVNIVFTKEGVKIVALNEAQVALVYVKLNNTGFDYYYCEPEEFVAGINTIAFYTVIKSIGTQDILTISLDKDNQNELFIKIENGMKNKIDRSWYKLLDIDTIDIGEPTFEYDFIVKMPSSEFQSICKIMKDIGSEICVCSHNNQIKISCEGDFCKKEVTLIDPVTDMMDNSSITSIDSININADHMVRQKFALKFLSMFARGTSLCNEVKIMLGSSAPLVLQYTVAALGDLMFALSPKIDE